MKLGPLVCPYASRPQRWTVTLTDTKIKVSKSRMKRNERILIYELVSDESFSFTPQRASFYFNGAGGITCLAHPEPASRDEKDFVEDAEDLAVTYRPVARPRKEAAAKSRYMTWRNPGSTRSKREAEYYQERPAWMGAARGGDLL